MYVYIYISYVYIYTHNVDQTIKKHPQVITIFIRGTFTIPSHGWFMA